MIQRAQLTLDNGNIINIMVGPSSVVAELSVNRVFGPLITICTESKPIGAIALMNGSVISVIFQDYSFSRIIIKDGDMIVEYKEIKPAVKED